jgi:hypothetical protein
MRNMGKEKSKFRNHPNVDKADKEKQRSLKKKIDSGEKISRDELRTYMTGEGWHVCDDDRKPSDEPEHVKKKREVVNAEVEDESVVEAKEHTKYEKRELKAEEDPIKVDQQNYVCVSFVAPYGTRQKSNLTAIKIRGAFETEEEAEGWAEQLRDLDPDWDTWVMSMYNWCPFPPRMSDPGIKVKYTDPQIQKIIDRYQKEDDFSRRFPKEQFTEEKYAQLMGKHVDDEDTVASSSIQEKGEEEEVVVDEELVVQ